MQLRDVRMFSVRGRRHVHDGERREQLFDLSEDPWEMNDLHADPTCAEVRSALAARCAEWQTDLADDREQFGRKFWV